MRRDGLRTFGGNEMVSAKAITLAKLAAIKAVKREVFAQRGRVAMPLATINALAANYLREHPELIEEAAPGD